MSGAIGSSQSVTRHTALSPLPGTPLSAQQSKTLSNTGLAFAKSSLSQDAWIDGARSAPKNSQWHTQYTALVNLSGGQTHNAALKVVLDRYQASLALFDPNATASDRQAAQAGWADQLMTGLKHLDPFTGVETLTAKGLSALASNPEIAKTPWGKALAGLAQNAATVGAFQDGIREGVWEGGKSLVTGIAGLAGNIVQYGGDHSRLGMAGDALRGITGTMPGWLEATIPSAQRAQLSDTAIKTAASNAFNYIKTHTPEQAGADIGAAIGKAWDGLKADHAKAAAGGPAAEARWWGKTAGRIGFEVAATFVPVAGIAGKISKGTKAAELGVDAARGAEGLTDAGRVAGKLAEVYKLAPAAKLQIDMLADKIAAQFGGQVAKAPIKGEARALEKAIEYGGDVSRIKDLARNTIIVKADRIEGVVAALQKSGAQIKIIDGASNPLGYSGVNATIKTNSGLVAEIQVNSPKMIFAKESPANARAILGEATYDKIAKEVGVPGGQGHKFYEQHRSLPDNHPDRAIIEKASRAYYDKFR